MDNNGKKIQKLIPLLTSRLEHRVILVSGLPFSKKPKITIVIPLVVITLSKFGQASGERWEVEAEAGGGGGGGSG